MARGRRAKCPYCGSQKTYSKGYRKTSTLGLRKIRFCTSCRRRFTVGSSQDTKKRLSSRRSKPGRGRKRKAKK